MGRYYKGDIEGKFWFGVQSSTDADYFGVKGEAPATLEYYFEESDLPKVKKGIAKCKATLKDWQDNLNHFFKEHNVYNDEMIAKEYNITTTEVRHLLEWYARLQLGKKIKACLEDKGYCQFQAEL